MPVYKNDLKSKRTHWLLVSSDRSRIICQGTLAEIRAAAKREPLPCTGEECMGRRVIQFPGTMGQGRRR